MKLVADTITSSPMFANIDPGMQMRGHPRHGPYYRMPKESDDGIRHHEVMEQEALERKRKTHARKEKIRCELRWARHKKEIAARAAQPAREWYVWPYAQMVDRQRLDEAFALKQKAHREACEAFLRSRDSAA